MKTKQSKTKMNVRLLRRIERQIMAEPKQFDMGAWFRSDESIPNCGTAACIAGWAVTLKHKINPCQAKERFVWNAKGDFCDIAEKALGISSVQAERLFFADEWPCQFRRDEPNNPKQAVRRIEHFISTKGNE